MNQSEGAHSCRNRDKFYPKRLPDECGANQKEYPKLYPIKPCQTARNIAICHKKGRTDLWQIVVLGLDQQSVSKNRVKQFLVYALIDRPKSEDTCASDNTTQTAENSQRVRSFRDHVQV